MNNKMLTPFSWCMLQSFPFIEATFDAIDNYSLLCKIIEYVNKNIEKTNQLGIKVEELNNWFKTLDLQDEINKKLDEMAQTGELQTIIESFIKVNSIRSFKTVNDMKENESLTLNSLVKTFGYYELNDGGDAFYVIKENLVANDMNIIALNNGLFAELLTEKNIVNAKKFGAKLDSKSDDTIILQKIIDYAKENNLEVLLNGYAYVTSTIDTKGIKLRGIGKLPKASATYNSSKYGNIEWDYLRNINNGSLITFEDYVNDVLISGSGIISDVANPILKCDHKDGKFNLENICICGWIRTENQEGLLSTDSTDEIYIGGQHHFNNISVINCGGNGIHINSLELVNPENLFIGYNMGYGLFIDGIIDKDTPFEYVKISNSEIVGNKLDGIYALNSFRKSVEITKCDFSRNGLYKQLDIQIPTNTQNLIAGCKINGWNSQIESIQDNFIFCNNYGEEIEILLSILTYEYGHVFNNIDVHDCIYYPNETTNNNSLFYLDNDYCKYFSYYNNKSNGNQIKLSTGVRQLIALIVDENYYSVFSLTDKILINNKITRGVVNLESFGNLNHILVVGNVNAQIPAWENIISNLPKPLNEIYPPIRVNDVNKSGTIFENGTLQCSESISSGSTVSFEIWYFSIPFQEK